MSDLASIQALSTSDDEPHDAASVPPSGDRDCPNCGARLQGRYCSGCGQLDQPLRLPAHRYVTQAVTEFFGIDGRVWPTLGSLLFKPGTLTNAYLQGRRRRYLRPLRVYLSSTLLFFFLLSVLDPVGRVSELVADRDEIADTTMTAGSFAARLDSVLADEAAEEARQQALVDSLRSRADSLRTAFRADSLAGRFSGPEAEGEARDRLGDVVDRAADETDRLGRLGGSLDDRRLVWQREQVAAYPPDSLIRPGDLVMASEIVLGEDENGDLELGPLSGLVKRGRAYERLKTARTTDDKIEAGLDLARVAIAKIPVVLFLMLPVFALLLKLIYVRRGWYYSEHLVFGLHTHAFAFLVFALVAVLAVVADGREWTGALDVVLLVSIPVYFLIAQKRVYGQGWIKTLVKAALLGATYSVVLTVFGLTLAVVLAFFG